MAGLVTNVHSLDTVNFKTSKRADAANDLIKSKLGLEHRYDPARLAIAHSLAMPDLPPPLSDEDRDGSGKIIMGKTLFGEDELPLWVAMIVEKAGLMNPTVELFQDQVQRHWHRGILMLQTEWENCDGVYERFILHLAERAGLPAHGYGTIDDNGDSRSTAAPGSAVPIMLRLGDPGTDLSTGLPVTWLLNGKGSPHVALMGGTGSGKTRLARSLLGQIREQVKVPCLIFDFKGDLAGNSEFVSEIGAMVLVSPSQPVPLDVLHLSEKNETEIIDGAIRFRDSFVLIPKARPGPMQSDSLRDAAQTAYRNNKLPIGIAAIRDELKTIYAQTSRKGDTLTATFNELTQWNLFVPKMTPGEFFGKSWIIDVHEAQTSAQRLVVFLVLDALYAHIKSQVDAPMDRQNHRALRMTLVVDEARRVLSYGQPSLISLVRESRSKGMSVFLISQSPEDFDTVEDNFLDQIGLTACFRSNGTSPRVLKACLGQAVDLAGLPDGVAVTRLPNQPGVTRIKAWE